MRDYKFNIGVGVKDDQFFGESNYIRLESSAVVLRVEDEKGRTLTLSQGDSVTVKKPFERLYLSHESGVAQPITIVVGKDVEKLSAIFSGSVTGSVSIAQGTVQTHSLVAVGQAAVLLVAASSTRRAVVFENFGGTTVYLGSNAGVTAGRGKELAPGDIWIEDIAAAAAWYGKQLTTVSGPVPASSVNITELS